MLWWNRARTVSGALAQQRSVPPSLLRVIGEGGPAQMRMELVTSAADYALHAYRLVRDAVEGGAQFVVFPEYTGAPLLGLFQRTRVASAIRFRRG